MGAPPTSAPGSGDLLVRREDLRRAAHLGIVTSAQADELWALLASTETMPERPRPTPRPRPLRKDALAGAAVALAFALGGILVKATSDAAQLGASDWFGGAALFAIAFAAGSCSFGSALAIRRTRYELACALAAAAVIMVPLAVHGLELWTGPWFEPPFRYDDLGDWMRGRWFPVELATIAAIAGTLAVFRAPILDAILGAALWLTAQDVAPLVLGASPSWRQRALLSAIMGVMFLGGAFIVDRRTRADHAGWLYFAGLVALFGGLTTYQTQSAPAAAVFAIVNAALVGLSLVLGRASFAAFGAVGLAGYAGYLSNTWLDPAATPFVLVAIGGALTFAAIGYRRRWAAWSSALRDALPPPLQRLLPPLPW